MADISGQSPQSTPVPELPQAKNKVVIHYCNMCRWMLRSAALTMAAVTLRIYLLIAMMGGLSYEDVSGIIAWACWIPNLIVAELVDRHNKEPVRAQRPSIGVPA